MNEALRRAGHSAAVSLAPAPPALSGIEGSDLSEVEGLDSPSADLVQPLIELDDYVPEVSVDALLVGDRHVDDPHVDDRPPEPPAVSDSEVEAMHAISRVLTGLPDPDARARVLRWAAESFVEGGLRSACCERAAASGRLSATSMIHGFVADFQQLVRDWHGCFDHPDDESR